MRRLLLPAIFLYAAVFALAAAPPTQPGRTRLDGRQIFRFDTFGDEQLWTTTLHMPEALATVSPAAALAVGLKVDSQALPNAIARAIVGGKVNPSDPAVTARLLSLNAVVGVIGTFAADGSLQSVGITCALCHSTVDDSLTKGIGRRLDGWPNRDLDVGKVISLSPVLTPAQRTVFLSWGPGRYDARLQAFDGTHLIPLNSTTLPVLIPPAFGLKGVGFETYTGDGPISYWNNYVAVTQMGGHGTFRDPRMPLTIVQNPDLVTPKLPALLAYQLSLEAPAPPPQSFDRQAARRGDEVFDAVGRCSECHIEPTFTDVLAGSDPTMPFLHPPTVIGTDPAYAFRSVTKMYRTTPLRGLWQHPPYFHDGSAKDLEAVVDHYNSFFNLGLTARQKADLIEYLKSL